MGSFHWAAFTRLFKLGDRIDGQSMTRAFLTLVTVLKLVAAYSVGIPRITQVLEGAKIDIDVLVYIDSGNPVEVSPLDRQPSSTQFGPAIPTITQSSSRAQRRPFDLTYGYRCGGKY